MVAHKRYESHVTNGLLANHSLRSSIIRANPRQIRPPPTILTRSRKPFAVTYHTTLTNSPCSLRPFPFGHLPRKHLGQTN